MSYVSDYYEPVSTATYVMHIGMRLTVLSEHSLSVELFNVLTYMGTRYWYCPLGKQEDILLGQALHTRGVFYGVSTVVLTIQQSRARGMVQIPESRAHRFYTVQTGT